MHVLSILVAVFTSAAGYVGPSRHLQFCPPCGPGGAPTPPAPGFPPAPTGGGFFPCDTLHSQAECDTHLSNDCHWHDGVNRCQNNR
jgi:hypothetical protein